MSGVSFELPADLNCEAVQPTLIEWYEADHRDFLWRCTDDPYEVLVSEVASQQIQPGCVVEAWEAFLNEWPTTTNLTAADCADVVGFRTDHRLGCNNRAKYLHEAARQVEGDHGDELPRTPDGLPELVGVGLYTANTVAFFVFNNDDAVVDTNVKRVLHRVSAISDDDAAFEAAASRLMPDGESRVWNNAIMEPRGVACGKTPICGESGCSWRRFCHACETGDFAAPGVPTQPSFEGSRRQFCGRVVRILGEYDELGLSELGLRVYVGYDGGTGAEQPRGLVDGFESDGLVGATEDDDGVRVLLAKQSAFR